MLRKHNQKMHLIVGLGNPGRKYKNTRHNIGSRLIDELQSLNLENVVLIKPKTFMNESGNAVKLLLTRYKLPITNLLVVHDDIDLPLGKIKISKSSGSAGHKGVESIMANLKTKNFVRIRMGIRPKAGKPKNVESFVLKNFKKEEEEILKETIKKTVKAVEMIIKDGAEKTMNEYNR